MDKVSVVIPFYNCRYIGEAIESLLAQTYGNIEIIVIDDGSTLHLDKLEPYKKQVTYVRKENGGTATALNAGIQIATGKYFCWLSADDSYKPTKIEKQVKYMETYGVRACYTGCETIGKSDSQIDAYFNQTYSLRSHFLKALLNSCFIHGCTVMLHMDLLREVGPLDVSYRYTHDYEMWLRVGLSEEFYYLSEKLVNYRVHEEMGTVRHQREIKQEVLFIKRQYRNKVLKKISELRRDGH
ncbi:glycosyltransferase [Cytobacillus sp. FSL W7-1323]|uniref:glycosyltransferase family 2 protein n=1 Tax=Cytobacillus sp. FSL W7-1323 TaxID=2921700 RepID=UPI003158058B